VYNGIRMEDGLRKIGGDPARLAEARIAPHSFCCYLELHIEQGGTLDQAKIPIGVVEGVVSIDEYQVEIHGFANHAGTTPMRERRNALLAAAKLIAAVQDVVTREPGRQVGTVGQLQVFPNAHNVVPGLVKHSIELRDLSAEKVARLAPMGMIFIPSIGGISHSPKELTAWRDCANGANVLLQTILSLDRR